MAFVDACWFTAGSSGTADFTDGTALSGFRNMSGAGAANGKSYSYRAESLDRTQWEIGVGVYSSGTGTLSRTVTASSAGGTTKTTFSAAPIVSLQPLKSDLDAMGLDAVAGRLRGYNAQVGTTYSFVATDVGILVSGNNAAAQTFTVNTGVLANPGTDVIDLVQLGAGQITVAAGAGMTVLTPDGNTKTKIRGQNSTACIVYLGSNTFLLFGDTAA